MNTIKTFYAFLIMLIIVVFSSCNAQKNAIVAHRGAWKKNNLPENSIASLQTCYRFKTCPDQNLTFGELQMIHL